jgi:ATP-dependent RNA helicase DeaD
MSGDVRKVASRYLLDPQQVQVNKNEMLSASIEQVCYFMRESDKPEILCKLIDAAEDFYGIIFCQTKSLVTDLTRYLTGRGYKIDALHGDKSQTDREKTMRAFREKKINILACTDVASRGLDVKDITHVVNYSLPREMDVYVHRIGRTARVGKHGIAMNLVTPSQRHLMSRIEHMTRTKMVEGKIPTRKDVGAKKIAAVLPKFQNQTNYTKAMELLGPEWQSAASAMTPDEIIGRFMSMLFPEVFEIQYREKTTQPPGMVDSRKTNNDEERPRRERSGGSRYGKQQSQNKEYRQGRY